MSANEVQQAHNEKNEVHKVLQKTTRALTLRRGGWTGLTLLKGNKVLIVPFNHHHRQIVHFRSKSWGEMMAFWSEMTSLILSSRGGGNIAS